MTQKIQQNHNKTKSSRKYTDHDHGKQSMAQLTTPTSSKQDEQIHRSDSTLTQDDIELDNPVPVVKSEGSDDPLRKPIIHRTRTVLEDARFQEIWDSDEIDDLLDAIEAERKVEEETKEEEKDPELVARTVGEEFFNLNQGILTVFHQHEHHTKLLLEKMNELETKVKNIIDTLNIVFPQPPKK